MLRVRDLMTRQVLTLRGNASVRSAAWSLHTAHVSGAPVRDCKGNLVGVLSNADLSALARTTNTPEDVRIEEAMTPVVWSVHPDDNAIDAVKLMVERGIHRVVVIRRPGQVEGIITSMDILRSLSDGRFLSRPSETGDEHEQLADSR